MNFDNLNKVVNYIENNITEDIDYKNLAKIVGVSEYNLRRIWNFLTDVSLSEYIRKRRLSKAFEDLKNTDMKIIDIAVKYNYDSSISFSRAFKKMFNATPNEIKKSKNNFKVFPIIKFKKNKDFTKTINYKIEKIDNKTIYSVSTFAYNHEDLLYKIRKLYNNIRKNGLYDKFNIVGQYAISLFDNEKYCYFVGSESKLNNLVEFNILKGKYAVFEVGSRKQKDIIKVEKAIYSEWLNSTSLILDGDFSFEFYKDNNTFIYIKIKDKQK